MTKISKIWYSTTDDEFRQVVSSVNTWKDLCELLGVINKGSNASTIKRRIKELNIDISHFSTKHRIINSINISKKVPLSELMVQNSTYSRKNLKKRLLKENVLKNECCICGLQPTWNDMPIVMILDHINGVADDNRLDNLRLLCPNCNSQLDTHCGRNNRKEPNRCLSCSKQISNESDRCVKCSNKINAIGNRKVDRPSYEDLRRDLQEMSFLSVGRKYGVSDNAIRKWIRCYLADKEND